jgi:hypothetical protein
MCSGKLAICILAELIVGRLSCLCFLFRYTQEGRRGVASLKGRDVQRAQLLLQLAHQTGLGVALVQARCHESGDAGDDEYENGERSYVIVCSSLIICVILHNLCGIAKPCVICIIVSTQLGKLMTQWRL